MIVSNRSDADLGTAARHVWWHDYTDDPVMSARGFARIELGDAGVVTTKPFELRAAAALFTAAAEDLDRLYAEHGVEPPAAHDGP